MKILNFLRSLMASRRNDDKGAILAEYGILAVGIAVVVAGAVWALGGAVVALYDLPAPF
jgi:Flp pilus assembly pilin Flp